MAVTLTQIAKEAGVSLSLVSRLISRDPTLQVSLTTRQRVLDVHRRLGGHINTRAAVRKQCRVAVPISHDFAFNLEAIIASPWWRNAEKSLLANDGKLTPVFISHQQRHAALEEMIKGDATCDGLLFLSGIIDQQIADLLNDYQFPHVSTSMSDAIYHVNTICGDPYHGIRRIVRHLVSAGHQRVAYLGHRTEHLPIFAGEMMAMDMVLRPEDLIDPGYLSNQTEQQFREGICHCAMKVLKRKLKDKVTAIVCRSDVAAFGLMDAMKKTGIVPGKDMAVIGYDDIESRGKLYADKPLLTTVRNPFEEIGRHLAELFLEQVRGGRTRIVHEYVPSPLIVRESSPHSWPAPAGAARISALSKT